MQTNGPAQSTLYFFNRACGFVLGSNEPLGIDHRSQSPAPNDGDLETKI